MSIYFFISFLILNQDFTKVIDKHISILPEGLALREFSNRILINSLRYSGECNQEIIDILSETSTTEENHRELSNILTSVFKDTSNAKIELNKAYSILLNDIKKNPENDYAYWKAADIYLRKNDNDELRKQADLYYRKAIKLKPENPDYYMFYGEFLFDNSKIKEALKYFIKADSVYENPTYNNPKYFKHYQILKKIAYINVFEKKYNEAMKIYNTLENDYKDELESSDYQYLILCYIYTNQIKLAKDKCLECIEKYPFEAKFFYFLGLLYHLDNEFESALKYAKISKNLGMGIQAEELIKTIEASIKKSNN